MLYSHNSLATSFVCGVLPYYSIMHWRQLLWWVWMGPYGSPVMGFFLYPGVLCGLEPRWGESGQRWKRQGPQNVGQLCYSCCYSV